MTLRTGMLAERRSLTELVPLQLTFALIIPNGSLREDCNSLGAGVIELFRTSSNNTLDFEPGLVTKRQPVYIF